MDEDGYNPIQSMRHDKWSVLILALSVATNVVQDISDGLQAGSILAAQHANQKIYDRKFSEMTRKL